jgi:uncharacterized membrane protein
MNNKFLKEAVLWVITLLPYAYLAMIWGQLPDQVPTHFNVDGKADNWSAKATLLLLPAGLGIIIYVVMLIIPAIDPKGKIQQMGDKYYTFRLMLSLFMALLSYYILSQTHAGNMDNPGMLIALIGGLFAVMGNYFQTLRPNYFIGLRTPWTLESELVWKKTHRLAGRLWMAGGLLLVVLAFAIQNGQTLMVIMGCILPAITLVPVIYSYLEFQREKKSEVA